MLEDEGINGEKHCDGLKNYGDAPTKEPGKCAPDALPQELMSGKIRNTH